MTPNISSINFKYLGYDVTNELSSISPTMIKNGFQR